MPDPSKTNSAKTARSENLQVSHILQKANIKLEDGTKSSGAAAENLITRPLPPWCRAGRPFLSFIPHNPTSAVYLWGRQTRAKECVKETMPKGFPSSSAD